MTGLFSDGSSETKSAWPFRIPISIQMTISSLIFSGTEKVKQIKWEFITNNFSSRVVSRDKSCHTISHVTPLVISHAGSCPKKESYDESCPVRSLCDPLCHGFFVFTKQPRQSRCSRFKMTFESNNGLCHMTEWVLSYEWGVMGQDSPCHNMSHVT